MVHVIKNVRYTSHDIFRQIFQKKPKRLKKKKESWLSRLAEIREKLPSHDLEKNSEAEGGRMWECELCQNSFNRKDHLAKHIAFVHERYRVFVHNHARLLPQYNRS